MFLALGQIAGAFVGAFAAEMWAFDGILVATLVLLGVAVLPLARLRRFEIATQSSPGHGPAIVVDDRPPSSRWTRCGAGLGEGRMDDADLPSRADYGNFIAGHWQPALAGGTFESRDPADGTTRRPLCGVRRG